MDDRKAKEELYDGLYDVARLFQQKAKEAIKQGDTLRAVSWLHHGYFYDRHIRRNCGLQEDTRIYAQATGWDNREKVEKILEHCIAQAQKSPDLQNPDENAKRGSASGDFPDDTPDLPLLLF
jgi:hypothetical protein